MQAAVYAVEVDVDDEDWIAAGTLRLSRPEQEEVEPFRRRADRARALAGRALARWAIAQHARVDARTVRFERDALGRPRAVSPKLAPDFNVAHSGSRVLCGVACAGRIGVDVEEMRPIDVAVGRSVFSPAELRYLAEAPAHASVERFYRIWTLKEAFLKACGTGFRTDARRHSVVAYADGRHRLAVDGWNFHATTLDGYAAAWCADSAAVPTAPIEVPLSEL